MTWSPTRSLSSACRRTVRSTSPSGGSTSCSIGGCSCAARSMPVPRTCRARSISVTRRARPWRSTAASGPTPTWRRWVTSSSAPATCTSTVCSPRRRWPRCRSTWIAPLHLHPRRRSFVVGPQHRRRPAPRAHAVLRRGVAHGRAPGERRPPAAPRRADRRRSRLRQHGGQSHRGAVQALWRGRGHLRSSLAQGLRARAAQLRLLQHDGRHLGHRRRRAVGAARARSPVRTVR